MKRRTLRRTSVLAVVAAVIAFIGVGVAWAYFTATDAAHSAQAAADSLPAGQTPAVSVSYPSGVPTATITFNRSATANGRTVSAFVINRYASATGGSASSTFTCTPGGSGSSVSCVQSAVPAGTWYYSDQPMIAGSNWTGTESARSNSVASDTIAPTVGYSQTPAANGNGYNTTAVTATLTAADTGASGLAYITYKVDAATSVQVNASTASFPISGEGNHTVTFSATDNAGNTSSSQQQTIIIDSTKPGAPVLTSAPSVINTANSTSVSFGGTAEANSTVTVTLTDVGSAHSVTATAATGTGGSWSVSGVNPSNLNDGTVSITVSATDLAGNVSTPPTQTTIPKDTAAPAVPLISVPASGGYINSATNSATYTVSGTKDANTSLALTVTDPSSAHTITKTIGLSAGTTWSTTIDSTTLNQGTITYSAVATDAAGNTSSPGTTSNTKDTVAPAVPVISVPASGGYINSATNSSTYSVSGTKPAGAGVVLTVTDPATAHTITKTIAVDGNTTWSTAIDSTILNQGTITYSAVSNDAAGNTSTAGVTTNTKDTVAPSPPVISAPASGGYINSATNSSTYSVSGTKDTGTSVVLTVTDPAAAHTITKSLAADGNSAWSTAIDSTSLNQGTITYSAVATDAAGNTSTPGTTSNTKDTVAPTNLNVACSAGNSGNPVKVTCSGGAGSASGDGTTITVVISKSGQTTVNVTGTRTGGTWTTSGNDLVPKNVTGWTATATQTDAAGNSTTANTTFNS